MFKIIESITICIRFFFHIPKYTHEHTQVYKQWSCIFFIMETFVILQFSKIHSISSFLTANNKIVIKYFYCFFFLDSTSVMHFLNSIFSKQAICCNIKKIALFSLLNSEIFFLNFDALVKENHDFWVFAILMKIIIMSLKSIIYVVLSIKY